MDSWENIVRRVFFSMVDGIILHIFYVKKNQINDYRLFYDLIFWTRIVFTLKVMMKSVMIAFDSLLFKLSGVFI